MKNISLIFKQIVNEKIEDDNESNTIDKVNIYKHCLFSWMKNIF